MGQKVLSPDQLSLEQQKGLEQALAQLRGQGMEASPLTDPSQEILATAVHNQEMKNHKL
jgi:hypothetical protein